MLLGICCFGEHSAPAAADAMRGRGDDYGRESLEGTDNCKYYEGGRSLIIDSS
jgi:hypothetical protein